MNFLKGRNLEPFDLDTPLIAFSPSDQWTIRDACEGTQIFGSIGSGKTSGSGATIAKSFLNAGFGGLVLCAKPDERKLWERYARETGRSDSLVIFSPDHEWRLNFLDYEMRHTGRGSGLTENIVSLFTRIAEIVEGKQEVAGGDDFWERAMKELVRNAIDLLAVSQGTVTLDDIVRIVADAPLTHNQVTDDDWQKLSFCFACMRDAETKAQGRRQKHDVDVAITYWSKTFPHMGDRTRSSIVATFTSIADILLHGDVWELFSTETTIVPETTFKDGTIIIVDTPIQEYHEQGRLIGGLMKYLFQRAILRRDVSVDPRPVFLWVDEAQNFVSSYDFQYQAVARSARACTVYLTQNISNYYSVLGTNAHDEANALTGNFQTRIWHANSDFATNEAASNLIGQRRMMMGSYGRSDNMEGESFNAGGNEAINYAVLPFEFTTLRKGGVPNNLEVDAILYQGGRRWNATSETYMRVTFKQ